MHHCLFNFKNLSNTFSSYTLENSLMYLCKELLQNFLIFRKKNEKSMRMLTTNIYRTYGNNLCEMLDNEPKKGLPILTIMVHFKLFTNPFRK